MAFDTDTRNKLAKMVADARELLKNEFTQQLQELYGIQPDGKITAQCDIARVLRERVVHISGSLGAGKKPLRAAVDRMTREQSFSVLNRFAALRMCEERGLLQQCVGGELQSKGFQVYLQTAGSGLGGQYERFRTFIFSIFDEIAIDLGILFDRFSPFGLLFPREAVLGELLEIINREELKHIWAEDEAIGWIYQYFNSPEERKAMRKASAAPRNSRELAVRNQFFTPRYVVEFLTDNTLGRIWYEMRQGDTSLKDNCRYLVCRPNEVFLETGQEPPEEDEALNENLSQEELLNKTTYIPFRAQKDPRDIKILDPACGSGHFLLYAFDLLETIYEEAWQDEDSPPSEATGHNLRDNFNSLEELRAVVPELIVRWNLHGIDIDPRAVQIAALALWLRAQRLWQTKGVRSAERPLLTKSNIVCAESMPGDENMLKDFTDGLKPKVLGQLVEVIFQKMKLAGEAGSLLKIEEEIKDSIVEARKQWEAKPKPEQAGLFPEMNRPRPKQQDIQFDVSEINDVKFWDRAEALILQSLQEYAERAENGLGDRRRMFAEDAAQGFAFIDICRKRFDVVLMNPPFGSTTGSSKVYIEKTYPISKQDLACAFVDRWIHGIDYRGRLGAITTRTPFFLPSSKDWRAEIIIKDGKIDIFADLGYGVLEAMVETAIYVLENRQSEKPAIFIRLLQTDNKGRALAEGALGTKKSQFFYANPYSFRKIPGSPLSYWVSEKVHNLWVKLPSIAKCGLKVQHGMATKNDFRFLRLVFEVSPRLLNNRWIRYAKGGEFSRYYSDLYLVTDWERDGLIIHEYLCQKYPYLKGNTSWILHPECDYYKIGLTYSRRTQKGFSVRAFPEGCRFDKNGPVLFSEKNDLLYILGVLNSQCFQNLLNLVVAWGSYETGIIEKMPIPLLDRIKSSNLDSYVLDSLNILQSKNMHSEINNLFTRPALLEFQSESLEGCFSNFKSYEEDLEARLEQNQSLIDESVYKVYGINNEEFLSPEENNLSSSKVNDKLIVKRKDCSNDFKITDIEKNINNKAHELISWCIGCLFGRWDVRIGKDKFLVSKVNWPFDQLPVCPPGMLVGPDGLPAKPNGIVSKEWLSARLNIVELPLQGSVKKPSISDNEYPLKIAWNGIIVFKTDISTLLHQQDIVHGVREVLDLLWGERAEVVEQETCEALGISSLWDYFRKPYGFFAHHLKSYSKSRRKAPIYWPISTGSGNYTLWLYYQRLTDQTLFTCVTDSVNPKIETATKDIERLRKELSEAGNTQKRDELEKLQDFRQELIDFRDELLRVAKLPYKPNLNDGVLITAAPLWKLFRLKKWQNDLKACWEKLETGEYDWAHLAYSIWPDRVREKCRTDRSLAIAHNLEHLCEIEPKKTKKEKSLN
jgi:hypothetical protein